MRNKRILFVVLVFGLSVMPLLADNGRVVYDNVLVAFGPSAVWGENYNRYSVSLVVTVKLNNGKVVTSPAFRMDSWTAGAPTRGFYWDRGDVQEILIVNVSRL
jgi:hypothetical protein